MGLSAKKIEQLDEFLLSDAVAEDAMMLSELDGFLAGVIICPEMIMPSEWMPRIWGSYEEAEFESLEQAEKISGLIFERYNEAIDQLSKGTYAPLYDVDTRNDDVIWEIWIEGFCKALSMRPESLCIYEDGSKAAKALSVAMRLQELAIQPAGELDLMEKDDELVEMAPDIISYLVQILHDERLAKIGDVVLPRRKLGRKIGRNDPCPCGSGRKFKKCCLN